MEHAVRKPTRRADCERPAREYSATVFIPVWTIAKSAGLANGLGVTLEFIFCVIAIAWL